MAPAQPPARHRAAATAASTPWPAVAAGAPVAIAGAPVAPVQHASPLAGVDLWSLAVEEVPLSVRDNPAACAILNDEELTRLAAFHFRRHRDLFLSTRLLARSVLSHYANLHPAAWRFHVTGLGQPALEPAQAQAHGLDALRFSLSRSTALSVCAVSLKGCRLGIDLEDLERDPGLLELIPTVLSPPEAAAHAREVLPVPAFLRYWTLKEAYVKARGLGLNLPVQAARFRFGPHGAVRPRFTSALADEASAWQFRSFTLRDRYAAALAFHPQP